MLAQSLRLTLRGEPFRCECDFNEFHRQHENYVCNACGAIWADPKSEVLVDTPVTIR